MTQHTNKHTNKHSSKGRYGGIVAALVANFSAANLVFAGGAQAPAPVHYGPFTISNMASAQAEQSKGTGKITVRLNGPMLSMKSSRYDIAAPRITLLLVKGGKPSRLSAQTAAAIGGVLVVFRNPDNDETTAIKGDRAQYTATNAAKQLGRLTVTGHVRTVTRGPAYGDTPLIQEWTSFYVDFVDENTTLYGGENGNASGVIREPAPRKKAASGGGGPKQ